MKKYRAYIKKMIDGEIEEVIKDFYNRNKAEEWIQKEKIILTLSGDLLLEKQIATVEMK